MPCDLLLLDGYGIKMDESSLTSYDLKPETLYKDQGNTVHSFYPRRYYFSQQG